jgi:hypothetical protein
MSVASLELSRIIRDNLAWNKARVTCFTEMLIALFLVKTINLKQLAEAFDSNAQLDSRYKRIQRFFSGFSINMDNVAVFIANLFLLFSIKRYLILDRTNWKLGRTDINILMLSVGYMGIAIPIMWINLGRAGNSNTAQRIALMNRFINKFGNDCILGVLGDREFIGEDWFKYLNNLGIPFYIRIKEDTQITNRYGKKVSIRQFFSDLRPGKKRTTRKTVNIWGVDLFLSATLDDKGKLKVIATNADAKNAIKIYFDRQEIETLFGCLKTRGFRFEDTHLTDPDRLNRLLVLLAIGFCWAYKTGEWIHDNIEQIKKKSHGRREVSSFRYGFSFIRESIFKMHKNTKDIKLCLKLFEPDELHENQLRLAA